MLHTFVRIMRTLINLTFNFTLITIAQKKLDNHTKYVPLLLNCNFKFQFAFSST